MNIFIGCRLLLLSFVSSLQICRLRSINMNKSFSQNKLNCEMAKHINWITTTPTNIHISPNIERWLFNTFHSKQSIVSFSPIRLCFTKTPIIKFSKNKKVWEFLDQWEQLHHHWHSVWFESFYLAHTTLGGFRCRHRIWYIDLWMMIDLTVEIVHIQRWQCHCNVSFIFGKTILLPYS